MKKVVQNKVVNPTDKQDKKTPVIIQLTDDDLEEVIGAGRCPPETPYDLVDTIDKPDA